MRWLWPSAGVTSSTEEDRKCASRFPASWLEIIAHPGGIKMGKANFGGVVKQVCLSTPEAKVDDYVLVHVGFALSTIDEVEAARTHELLKEMSPVAGTRCAGDQRGDFERSMEISRRIS